MAQLRIALTDPDGSTPAVAEGVPAGLPRQLGRFAVIGVASTLAYAVLYVLLRPLIDAQAANAASLLITAIANTAANRRITFATRGRDGALRHQVEGLVVFGLGLAVTGGSLSVLHALMRTPSTGFELGVLVTANLIATVLRFVLLKSWVFHPGRPSRARTGCSAAEERAR